MMPRAYFDRITVVLKKPRYPENIGAVARAMRNMGLSRLSIVDPENFDLKRVRKLATHEAANIVDRIVHFDHLNDALADMQYVVGTTARLGRQRSVVQSPSSVAGRLISIARQNQVALLFGPEDRGLTNMDLQLCHILVNIPTADFSSLNLSQAVMIICYEILRAGENENPKPVPRLAARHELDGMYATLKDVLVRIDYINRDNPDYWMNKIRRFGNRIQLRAVEVSVIRGICRQIDWYAKKCYQDGQKTAVNPEKSTGISFRIHEKTNSPHD